MLNFYRKIIALIDWFLLNLISWRMKTALEIEKAKRKDKLPICYPEVEEKKINLLKESARRKNLDENFIAEIFSRIMKESVRIQENQRAKK